MKDFKGYRTAVYNCGLGRGGACSCSCGYVSVYACTGTALYELKISLAPYNSFEVSSFNIKKTWFSSIKNLIKSRNPKNQELNKEDQEFKASLVNYSKALCFKNIYKIK